MVDYFADCQLLYWTIRIIQSKRPCTVLPVLCLASNMASRTNNNNKKKKRTSKTKKPTAALQGLAGAQQLVAAADHAALHQDPQQAVQLYTAAEKMLQGLIVETDSDTTDLPQARSLLLQAWEKRAELYVSLEDQNGALEDYQASLQLLLQTDKEQQDPNLCRHRAALHLYIGQLQEGEDALAAYQQGIGCLQLALEKDGIGMVQDDNGKDKNGKDKNGEENSANPKTVAAETRRQLAAAYCSVAEVYLTDLCFEPNAEQECESTLDRALQLTDTDGEPIADALQTTASLRLSQNKGLEAVDYILRSFEKMRVGVQALALLVGLREDSNPDQATELLETEAVKSLPGFEFRCQTAKLLLECAGVLKEETAAERDEREEQCVQAAVDVLGSLLAENDEVAEIWYLTGNAFAAMNPPNSELAAHYWERTLEMLISVKDSIEQELLEMPTEEETEALQMQLQEVSTQEEDVVSKLAELRHDGDAQPMEE